jgi:hypothetical protein
MIREKMWVERPVDTHLSNSRTSDGLSPLARDNETNDLATQVTLHPIDDDEADKSTYALPILVHGQEEKAEEVSLLGVAVVIGGLVAAHKLAPHAKRIWDDRAFPALKSTWGTITRANRDGPAVDEPAAIEGPPAAALQKDKTPMSSAEARERFAAALMARAFSDEQLRVLRGARIVDGEDAPELERALESLTPEQLENGTTLLLENRSPEELRDLLGISGPLRLTAGEAQQG